MVAFAVLAMCALAACTGDSSLLNAGQPASTPSVAIRQLTPPAPSPARQPAIPRDGAYVGAWTRPQFSTAEGRQQAVALLQDQLGRALDIVHVYRLWDEPLAEPSDAIYTQAGSTMLLSWAGTDTRSIVNGSHDAYIRQSAQEVADSGRPVFVEFRWEMDRPNLQSLVWSPADYVAAWKHVRSIFDQVGANNAAWVWCPLGSGFSDGNAPAYYPGDAWVDWLCVDVYPGEEFTPMSALLTPVLQWARTHPKPLMIGEFGVPRHVGSLRRVQWLEAARSFIKAHQQIKAVVYFDANPDGRAPHREYKLGDDPPALAAFSRLANDPYFRTGALVKKR